MPHGVWHCDSVLRYLSSTWIGTRYLSALPIGTVYVQYTAVNVLHKLQDGFPLKRKIDWKVLTSKRTVKMLTFKEEKYLTVEKIELQGFKWPNSVVINKIKQIS